MSEFCQMGEANALTSVMLKVDKSQLEMQLSFSEATSFVEVTGKS